MNSATKYRNNYLLRGGSWVGISGVISPLIWVITIVILLITLLITTHEPPSRAWKLALRESEGQALQGLARLSIPRGQANP